MAATSAISKSTSRTSLHSEEDPGLVRWSVLEVRDGAMIGEVVDAYTSIQALSALGDTACIFYCYKTRPGALTLYFTPEAWPLGKQFGAVPCSRPEEHQEDVLELLVGVRKCRDILHAAA